MSVTNRLVVLLPGFEHMPVEAHHRRFTREAAKTAPVYDMSLTQSEPLHVSSTDGGIAMGEFSLQASGDGWSANTDFILYGLGDITLFYASRNPLRRLLSGIIALMDFILTGTFFRFVATSWRYALFFVYPLLICFVILGATYGTGRLAMAYNQTSVPIAPAIALITAILLFWLAASKLHFLLLMDDWTFARDMARGKRPDVMRKLDRVIADAANRISSAPPGTEIVVAAHSLGAVCAIPILDAALPREGSNRYGLLTVGSSLLKVALHPAARTLRKSVETVVNSKTVWIDVQSLTDPMNFYQSDPVRDLNIKAGKSPILVRVRFRNQLCDAAYKSIRRDFFRVHRQFVFGVEKRTHYSWHAILCGPEQFADVAALGGLRCDRNTTSPANLNIAGTATT
ncbi:hypothetical protein [Phyllobacterium bourgognense]|uniref:Alpha/beta hydrolase n=1 Tax=Phyllobacterium bourgognense TaxID=314236 RepID=A0A368YSE1_9HYPH|nr:hypothetical protein [Phyllobacterium bourgognense]RCW83141.1 hypothetical protein C7476_106175 [Phyllobacterium bourgognense]